MLSNNNYCVAMFKSDPAAFPALATARGVILDRGLPRAALVALLIICSIYVSP